MSETQTEHRGWETNSDFTPHYLDDANFEFDGDEERNQWFWGLSAFAIVVSVSAYLLGQYLEPPKVVFPAPPAPQVLTNFSVPVYLPALPPGWGAQCIRMDGAAKILRPNWENPACKAPKK